MTSHVRIVADGPALARRGAMEFVRHARAAVARQGWFAVALSGGSTPKAMYDVLAASGARTSLPWSRIHVFFGDERHVPPDHADSNYRLAAEHLLTKVPLPDSNVHRIRGEEAQAAEAARLYAADVRAFFSERRAVQDGWPRFDLIFLGMGADGHTASLFPGTSAVGERAQLVCAPHVPKFNTHRVTFSAPLINAARSVVFLAGGEDKAETLKGVLLGRQQPETWPSQLIAPVNGRLDWIVDARAGAQVKELEPRVRIAPSVLAADFLKLGEGIAACEEGGADRVHVDVMDGRFVPNISLGLPVVEALRRATSLPLECHLMIEEPERYVSDFAAAGADLIIVHQENQPHLHRSIHAIRAEGIGAGVVINPATPVSVLDEILPDVDLVLLMSVNPGFGGQKFIPSTLARLAALKARLNTVNPFCEIEVDGGVGASTAAPVHAAGANVLVAGTSVFAFKDGPAAGVRALLAAATAQ